MLKGHNASFVLQRTGGKTSNHTILLLPLCSAQTLPDCRIVFLFIYFCQRHIKLAAARSLLLSLKDFKASLRQISQRLLGNACVFGTDSPVDFFLFQLEICHSDQLIQFTLGLYDLCLSGWICPALFFPLMNPSHQSKKKKHCVKMHNAPLASIMQHLKCGIYEQV